MNPYEWVITEPVTVRQFVWKGESYCLVFDDGVQRVILLTLSGELLLFNDEYVDVGDDLMHYLGVMEEAQQANGKEVRSEPCRDAS